MQKLPKWLRFSLAVVIGIPYLLCGFVTLLVSLPVGLLVSVVSPDKKKSEI